MFSAGVERVYGSMMSRAAKDLFEENGVHAEWGKLIGSVLDEYRRTVDCTLFGASRRRVRSRGWLQGSGILGRLTKNLKLCKIL
jgi:hypothetical protein